MLPKIDKITLRRQYRDARRMLDNRQQSIASENLCNTIKSNKLLQPNQTVALYLAHDGELSCSAVINWCWEQSVNVALPVIHPFHSSYLIFLLYTPDSVMVKNKFGISEPKLDVTTLVPLDQLSAVFLPLVAFDKDGNRLGMGGGFYDRTLAALAKNSKAKNSFFGIAHDCQEAPKLHVDKWDIGLRKIITPTRVICPIT